MNYQICKKRDNASYINNSEQMNINNA